MAALSLAFDILAKDNASKTFDKVGKSVDDTGTRFSKFGKIAAAGMAVAGAAVVAFAAKGVKDAIELDTKFREINTLFGTTGKAAEAGLGDITKIVKGVSKEVGIAQSTIADGLYNAISAGVPKDNVFDFMKVASKAAIAGVTDTNTAVNGLTTVVNAFGLSSKDAGKVADSLFTAVKGGKTTFRELSDSLFNVAPAAAAAGVSFQEVNAAIATLTSSGTPTSVATTQIRAALTGLQKPSKDLDKIFQSLGYTNAQTAIESKGLGFALDAVKKASGGNNGELQKLLGSTEAVSAANVLAGTGAKKFAAELNAQQKSAGATDKAFAEMEKSVSRQMERLKVNFQNLGIEVGQKVLPFINNALAGFTGKTGEAESAAYKMGSAVRQVTGFISDNKAILVPLVAVLGSLAAAVYVVNTAAKVYAATQAALNIVLAANPIGLVIVAVAALVAGVILAYKHSETFRNVVQGAMNAIKAAFLGMAGVALGVIDKLLGGYQALASAAGKLPGPLGAPFRSAAEAIGAMRGKVNDLQAGINALKGKNVTVSVTTIQTTIQRTIREGQQAVGRGLQARAAGGPVSAFRPYMVGELGPEMIVPRKSGWVLTAEQTAALGGRGGNTYNYNVQSAAPDAAATAAYLKRLELLNA